MIYVGLILAIGFFIYMAGITEPPLLKPYLKGRTEQQQDVIKYFWGKGSFPATGFLCKRITDAEYDNLVANKIKQINLKEKALAKIGLEASQVSEIDPVSFEGWLYGTGVAWAKAGLDHKTRSSAYQISWLFFSDTQVFIYKQEMNFDSDAKKVSTEEYFYKDITNFSTITDTIEQNFWDDKSKTFVKKTIDSTDFAITVPGDKFYCSMQQNDYSERVVQGMKAKLREKKA
jgi:hypothetical protein